MPPRETRKLLGHKWNSQIVITTVLYYSTEVLCDWANPLPVMYISGNEVLCLTTSTLFSWHHQFLLSKAGSNSAVVNRSLDTVWSSAGHSSFWGSTYLLSLRRICSYGISGWVAKISLTFTLFSWTQRQVHAVPYLYFVRSSPAVAVPFVLTHFFL